MEERYLLNKNELNDVRQVLLKLEAEHKRDNLQVREHLIPSDLLSRSLCAIGENARAEFLDVKFVKEGNSAVGGGK